MPCPINDSQQVIYQSIVKPNSRHGLLQILDIGLIEHRLDDWAGERGVAGLPARTIALTADGRILADGPTAEVFDRHGEALREAGCWLPRELEETLAPARVDGGAAPTHAAVGIAGPRDMAETAIKVPAVKRAVQLIAEAAASLPVKVKQVGADAVLIGEALMRASVVDSSIGGLRCPDASNSPVFASSRAIDRKVCGSSFGESRSRWMTT